MSDTITRLQFGTREYVLVGTAHVSQASITEVQEVIKAEMPDRVGVEIDAGRYKSLTEPQTWEKLDIFQIMKQGKGFLLLANLALSSFQKRIGQNLEVKPGQEMLAAVQTAQEHKIPFSFIDREVQVTLRRAWKKSSFWGKNKLLALLVGSVFGDEKVDETQIENLKKKNELDHMMEELSKELPTVKQVLIDERDQYLATSIFQAEGNKIVAVVGAGHVPGMVKHLQGLHAETESPDLSEISKIPPPSVWSKIWPYLFPAAFIGFLAAGLLWKGFDVFWQMFVTLALTTGGFAAVGSLIALAHPVTILVSFVMAPITTIFHPLLHIGYFTGISEAYFRRPRVGDLSRLGDDAVTVKGYYSNRFLRILLVLLLSTIGATIAMYMNVPLIMKSFFG